MKGLKVYDTYSQPLVLIRMTLLRRMEVCLPLGLQNHRQLPI